jgi:hypothetical protein
MLPLSFILPDAPRKGIVINLAAMRMFQFKGDSNSLAVSTYPLGVGTMERPSPMGQMYVARKATRPTWHVPASIAEDHRKKGDPLPAKILPGPQNPLGEYALYLSKPTYLIHGTNKPASIGLRATNGCIRLYPEDVKKLTDPGMCWATWTVPFDHEEDFWYVASAYYLSAAVRTHWEKQLEGHILWYGTTLDLVAEYLEKLEGATGPAKPQPQAAAKPIVPAVIG